MSEIIELQNDEYEIRDMPSKKHSTAQTNIIGLLFNDKRFKLFIELSLDASKIDLTQFELKTKDELIPDICVYTKKKPPKSESKPKLLDDDVLKVSTMPDLAIEILSPKQTITELLKKFNAFFELGWLRENKIPIKLVLSKQ